VRRFRNFGLAERLEILAGLKANGFAGSDGDFGAGARIATDSGFARLDGEDAKATQFDTVATAQSVLHRFKDSVHGGLCLGPWKAGAFNYPLDEVLFDQWMSPSCARSHVVGKYLTTKAYTAMVESSLLVVNFSSDPFAEI
jgi:hypothetical protein